tara:strand:+ start:700 stop:1146 length:447 start_codon:yes stop_codon:yes gene_type:complete
MILISHRGNLSGKINSRENKPDYVLEAIDAGYNVEIDVWYTENNNGWFLGHDKPQYRVNTDFLKMPEIWCHAKNINTLNELLKIKAHCFFHQRDTATLTSKGYIWTAPLEDLTQNSICVLPEKQRDIDINKAAGICSDYIDEVPYSTK